jgi:hypothetical protein
MLLGRKIYFVAGLRRACMLHRVDHIMNRRSKSSCYRSTLREGIYRHIGNHVVVQCVLCAGYGAHNVVVGGLLLHQVRYATSLTCPPRFGSLVTLCSYTSQVYEGSSPILLSVARGATSPYGVDPFYLASSTFYDKSLVGNEGSELAQVSEYF